MTELSHLEIDSLAAVRAASAGAAAKLEGARVAVVCGRTRLDRATRALESFRSWLPRMNLELLEIQFDHPSELLSADTCELLKSASVVVKLLHGEDNRCGEVQSILAALELSFTGNPLACDLLSQQKDTIKGLMRHLNVPTLPHWTFYDSVSAEVAFGAYRKLYAEVPFVVKPTNTNASEGLFVGTSMKDIVTAASVGKRYLIEPYFEGRVFTVGVVSLDGVEYALPPLEYCLNGAMVMDAQWKQSPVRRQARGLAMSVIQGLIAHSVTMHRGVRACISRSDFIVDRDGYVVCLEINTNIGLSENHDLATCFSEAGLQYSDLLWAYLATAASTAMKR
jgi:D-alanine-D-alanine ligase-like ATP-grasp enzyme